MRPIDADYLENMGYELHRTYRKDANTMVYEVKKIADVPGIEAEPVKHGRWVENDEDAWVCSFCGMRNCFAYVGHTLQDLYCPKCGAKMEE